MTDTDTALLAVENLSKFYTHPGGLPWSAKRQPVRAVDGISFKIDAGETVGLVGESGCGKSTLARTLLRLEDATAGRVLFRGEDVFALDRKGLRNFRRRVQVVFQDPYASLNPRMTVSQIINEAWQIHPDVVGVADRPQRCQQLLEQVGLRPEHAHRHPHQFSGGQRQRIGIARALALEPELIVLDEPVSALDMSIQAQVINLLSALRSSLGLSYLFIAHDLAVVRHISQRVAVMYLGSIVEQGDTQTLFEDPAHPYTQALLAASPVPDPTAQTARQRIRLQSELADPSSRPTGCRFHSRCWKATAQCAGEHPLLSLHKGREVACFHPD